ncbi:MAG: hypothetical protein Q8P61_03575, partial [Candidatus Nanopelagicales bacterium]|nr:hypothetical protein [Candidatus Nanopelagicales bacterium]
MSGGTKETKQTSDPWAAAQPALKTGLSSAESLFGSGDLFKPYTGSTVVPFSPQTQTGMGAVEGQAQGALASGALNRPMDFFGNLFESGGMSPDQQGVADQWRTTASGSELNQFSPEFENVLSRSLGDARTGVDLSVSGAGRYGSGQHTDVLADRLGRVSSEARLGEYGR